jgi:hypothetical protein
MDPSRFVALLQEYGQRDIVFSVYLVNGAKIEASAREISVEADSQTFSHTKANKRTVVDINAVTHVICVDPSGSAEPRAGQSGFLRKAH